MKKEEQSCLVGLCGGWAAVTPPPQLLVLHVSEDSPPNYLYLLVPQSPCPLQSWILRQHRKKRKKFDLLYLLWLQHT